MVVAAAEYVCKCGGIVQLLLLPYGGVWELRAMHKGVYTSRVPVSIFLGDETIATAVREYSNHYMRRKPDKFPECGW